MVAQLLYKLDFDVKLKKSLSPVLLMLFMIATIFEITRMCLLVFKKVNRKLEKARKESKNLHEIPSVTITHANNLNSHKNTGIVLTPAGLDQTCTILSDVRSLYDDHGNTSMLNQTATNNLSQCVMHNSEGSFINKAFLPNSWHEVELSAPQSQQKHMEIYSGIKHSETAVVSFYDEPETESPKPKKSKFDKEARSNQFDVSIKEKPSDCTNEVVNGDMTSQQDLEPEISEEAPVPAQRKDPEPSRVTQASLSIPGLVYLVLKSYLCRTSSFTIVLIIMNIADLTLFQAPAQSQLAWQVIVMFSNSVQRCQAFILPVFLFISDRKIAVRIKSVLDNSWIIPSYC